MTVYLCSHSQDTLKITKEQLKITNIIFAEHDKFSKEIPLLKQQINNLEFVNTNWIKVDSLRKLEIISYKQSLDNKDKKIEKLTKNRNRIFRGLGTINIFLICLLLI